MVRNTKLWTHAEPTESASLGLGHGNLGVVRPSIDSDAHYRLRCTAMIVGAIVKTGVDANNISMLISCFSWHCF